MFFASGGSAREPGKYRLLLEAAQMADRNGLSAVWTPERHFHPFGGLFPNPAMLASALAPLTERIQVRAGSLISPLHHTLRIAEEWSVVDNLSGGRAAVSFGSGWNVDDFVFFPERYARRHACMYEQIELIRRLWRGEELVETNSFGKSVRISLYPQPIQPELPVWITSSGHVETFISAGRLGANVLTHLIGQDLPTLAEKIDSYRTALQESHGAAARGKVSLMLHTFVGPDMETVEAKMRAPFREYLRSAIKLEQLAAEGGGIISGGHRLEPHQIPAGPVEELLDLTYERYLKAGSLIGPPDRCLRMVQRLEEIGVDEVACLIDFVDDPQAVLESLLHLCDLSVAWMDGGAALSKEMSVTHFLEDLEG